MPLYSKHCQTSRTRVRGGRGTRSGAIQARGRRGQDKKLGHFYVVSCKMTIGVGINHTTPHFAPHQVEVNNSTVFPTWNNMFSAPPIFSRKPLLCQLLSCRPALASFLTTTAQGLGWAGLGWLGWVGHRKTTKCQSRSGGRMDGMVQ